MFCSFFSATSRVINMQYLIEMVFLFLMQILSLDNRKCNNLSQ